MSALPLAGQVCTGSFGDPVVNLTFGNGQGSISDYVPAASYTYTSTPCPDDGFYTVTNSIINCFGDTWQHVSDDHTGGGNFMIVNASYQPGDFFKTSVTALCPNTTYEFSAWIMNIMRPFNSIQPNITFHIETPGGTVLASFESGNIPVSPSPQWRNYGFLFTTPPDNATIVLRMINNSPGGNGNDLALDDITFRPCGASINASIDGHSSDTINICEGNLSVYSFTGQASSVYVSPVYFWQVSQDSGKTWTDIPGANTAGYVRKAVEQPGLYSYRLAVVDASVAGITSCRIASNVLVINVHPKPVVNAGPDRIYIKGYPVHIRGSVKSENGSFTWIPPKYMSDTAIVDPLVSPPADITYQLAAASSFGCTNTDNVVVRAVDGIYVPNAFTPNGDGRNDHWRVPFLDVGLNADVSVFNRWGKLMYHVRGATVDWDGNYEGQPQPNGVYVYLVDFPTHEFPTLRGTVALIR